MTVVLETNEVVILAFEGPDKVGKTSLIAEVNRKSDYRYLCIDRFLASAWVYDQLSGRRERSEKLGRVERDLAGLSSMLMVTVVVTCDRSVLAERIQGHDEQANDRLDVLDLAIELFEEYARSRAVAPIIKIDTTLRSIDEAASEVIEKVNELCQHY